MVSTRGTLCQHLAPILQADQQSQSCNSRLNSCLNSPPCSSQTWSMNPGTLSSGWDGRERPNSMGQEKPQQKPLCSSPEASSNKTPAGISFPFSSTSHLGMRSATSEQAIIDIIPQNPATAGLAPQLQNAGKDSLTELSRSQTPAWIGIWDTQ